jgi:uncharacterized membrane protein
MITVKIFVNTNDEHIEEIKSQLDALQKPYPHQIVWIKVDQDQVLKEKYGHKTPFLETGPYSLNYPFQEMDLRVTLGAAIDRQRRLEEDGDEGYKTRLARGANISKTDRFSMWLANHYMVIFNLLLAIYVGLPFMAPVLEKNGPAGAANVIYKIYSPLCHQLAFRSWFLFGEQPYYPRTLAEIPGLKTFSRATGLDENDVLVARNYIGDPVHGYKVAFCERDVAIYGSLLLFGVVFSLTGKKIRPLPWYIWIFIGILPIGLDGGSQLTSLIPINLSWLPIRESNPILRSITGILFGLTTAWYGFPMIEESMRETKRILLTKFAVVTRNTD